MRIRPLLPADCQSGGLSAPRRDQRPSASLSSRTGRPSRGTVAAYVGVPKGFVAALAHIVHAGAYIHQNPDIPRVRRPDGLCTEPPQRLRETIEGASVLIEQRGDLGG